MKQQWIEATSPQPAAHVNPQRQDRPHRLTNVLGAQGTGEENGDRQGLPDPSADRPVVRAPRSPQTPSAQLPGCRCQAGWHRRLPNGDRDPYCFLTGYVDDLD